MKTMAAAFLLLFTLAAAAAERSYSGTWLLDLRASKPPDGIKEWRLDVDHAGIDFTVTVRILREGAEPFEKVYRHKLDGSRVKLEMAVPMNSVARIDEDGTIGLFLEDEESAKSRRIRRATRERWELSEDGKTLTVHREEIMYNGLTTFDMVFRRAAQ